MVSTLVRTNVKESDVACENVQGRGWVVSRAVEEHPYCLPLQLMVLNLGAAWGFVW